MTRTDDNNSNSNGNTGAGAHTDIGRQRSEALELHKAGNLPTAEAIYRTILQACDDGLTWHYLAVLQGQRGNHIEVVSCCEHAVRCGFVSASVFRNLGLAQAELGQRLAAKDTIAKSLSLDSNDAPLTLQWIRLQLSLGEEAQAFQALQAARIRFPYDSGVATELGGLAAQLNMAELAESEFQDARELQPQEATSWVNLGNILQMRGKSKQAVQAYAQALSIQPDFPEIYWYLAQNISTDNGSKWPERILNKANLPQSSNSAALQFAAGKIHHDAGRVDAAFSCFQTGNQLVRSSYHYSVDADLLRIRALLASCRQGSAPEPYTSSQQVLNTPQSMDSLQDPGSPPDGSSPSPIFIVGMPRSGSTLLEQLLAQHPDIAAGGEVTWLQRTVRDELNQAGLRYPDDQLKLNAAQVDKIRQKHLSALKARAQGAAFVTDKLPANFLCIPTIRRLFPAALIIHAKRDLLETCWSCYRHLFSGPQQFAYELSELAQYGRAVHEFIESVMPIWPDQVVQVKLEDLLENTELQMRGLLSQLNLPWHENCLRVEKTTDIVMTASALQVRQGINRKAAVAATAYAPHLQVLHNALRPTIVGRS